MASTILAIHVGGAILLIIAILSQEKSTGMGSAMAGSAGGAFYATKRGAAKVLHNASIILAMIFVASAIAYIIA